MNKRTIPAVVLGATLAVGLVSACSSSTDSDTPAATSPTTATESSAPTQSATESAETPAAPATEVVQQPSALTLTVADGKVTGTLTVAGSDQGVSGASISLVFRPDGGGDVTVSTVTTDDSGAFSANGSTDAGTWTASFLGTDAAGATAATAKVS